MDRATALGEAIKYMEDLQERVRVLEEQTAGTAQRPDAEVEDKGSANEQMCNSGEQRMPEIDAKVSDNNILVKIQCEKRRGLLVKVLGEVESLNLRVVNAIVAPFGSFALDITIIAKMHNELSPSVQDIVAALRSTIQDAT